MVTPASAAMALVSVLVANLLYFLIGFAIQGIAFWADNVWSLRVTQRLVAAILGGGLLPLTLFPGWARLLLDALPFPYLYWVPVTTLLGQASPLEWLQGLGVALAWCAGLALLAREVFRRGYLQYTGIGI
jgi:ABC-2 type transport system permease protein